MDLPVATGPAGGHRAEPLSVQLPCLGAFSAEIEQQTRRKCQSAPRKRPIDAESARLTAESARLSPERDRRTQKRPLERGKGRWSAESDRPTPKTTSEAANRPLGRAGFSSAGRCPGQRADQRGAGLRRRPRPAG